jgi:multiple sugar transport system ATP-binding protein
VTAQIELQGVGKRFGAVRALAEIDITIPKGRFVALVGPSGCGKSTLLRSIAGLERVTEGEMRIAGRRVNEMPPRRRDLAMVFQSYALYPHMSVAENLTYALRLKGVGKAERRTKAEEVARVIGLEELLDRRPAALSGGQRQRVAMGRAIVREPQAFLFDEPLSNLDAALRVRMRKEVRGIHDRIGATSVYVTHDQIEAMTMADHVVVLRLGRIEQQGPPLELYEHPANRFVAGFIGSPAMNFVPATGVEGGLALDLPGRPTLAAKAPPGRALIAGLRPEHLSLTAPDARGAVPATVGLVERTGSASYVVTDGEPEITVVTEGAASVGIGDPIGLLIAPERVHLFDPETGAALSPGG